MPTIKEISEKYNAAIEDDVSNTNLRKAGVKNSMVMELIRQAKTKGMDYKELIKKDISFENAVDIFFELTKRHTKV